MAPRAVRAARLCLRSRVATALRRDLSPFDFTLLVTGTIIGDGIFVVPGLAAQHMGPAQLASWVLAAVLAGFIGLSFMQCATIQPEVGGSFAYARVAFGPTVGFVAGWALYLGELSALPVFPLAFVRYLSYFVPTGSAGVATAASLLLIAFVTAVNLSGVRRGGRLNDLLTLAKLVPLVVVIGVSVVYAANRPAAVAEHLRPFAPLGWGGLGTATVLVFWAYAGFELAVLPAGEVQAPRRTLPRGLLNGIAIATTVYLLATLAVVVALPWEAAAGSPRPLADALGAMLGGLGVPGRAAEAFVSLGALISIVGVYDAFTLGLARLSYALATSASFPPVFGRLHRRTATPWVGLVFQAMVAACASLSFDISTVLATAVFFLGLCYAVTGAAALRLVARHPESGLHVPGLRFILMPASASGVYLAAQASLTLLVAGAIALAIGLGAYLVRRRAWQASVVAG